MSAFLLAVLNIGIVAAFSFSPTTDWAAHGGGLVAGLLLGAWEFRARGLPVPPPPARSRKRAVLPPLALAVFVAATAGLAWALWSGAVAVPLALLDVCAWQRGAYGRAAPACE